MDSTLKDQLGRADTLPDVASRPTGRAGSDEGARRFVLSLALEAAEKELGYLRLCELALPSLREDAALARIERHRRSAERHRRAAEALVERLSRDPIDDDGSRLRQATARRRVICLATCLRMAATGRDPEMARTVALECLGQARLMARSTWARLLVAAEVLHLGGTLVGSEP